MAKEKAKSDNCENSLGNFFPLILVVILSLVLVVLLLHWNYQIIATPKTDIQATVLNEKEFPADFGTTYSEQTITPKLIEIPKSPPPEPAPIVVQPVVIQPVVQPVVQPTVVMLPEEKKQSIAEEPLTIFVNMLVVDRISGVVQFPVFEKVPLWTVNREEKMTEFTFEGKRNVFFCRVLESIPYTDDDIPEIGAICYPDKDNPGKMIVIRCNQPERDVFRDGFGMYFKTKSDGILAAPEQANWFTRPISPVVN